MSLPYYFMNLAEMILIIFHTMLVKRFIRINSDASSNVLALDSHAILLYHRHIDSSD